MNTQNPLSVESLLQQEIDPAFAKRARFILDRIQKKRPKKILDAGCGRGFYPRALQLYDFPKEIVGIDVSDTYIVRAQKATPHDRRLHLMTGSVYNIPYPNDYYDCIISSEVLEHLTDPQLALAEYARVLKKDGELIITVPNEAFPLLWDPLNWILMRLFHTHVPKHIWWLAGIWADHERLYSLKSISKEMDSHFSVSKCTSIHYWSWPFSHFLLYGIGKNIVELAGMSEFDRFNFDKPRILSRVLAFLFDMPSTILDHIWKGNGSVNIALIAQKKP